MEVIKKIIKAKKKIVLIAHDKRKQTMLEWARKNRDKLLRHEIFATGTTGKMLQKELGMPITCFLSGPLGGDQQIGSSIVDDKVDFLVFFWDPFEPQPHDPDVKALLRIAVVWNIPVACNRASADFMFHSSLMDKDYENEILDYSSYVNRKIK